MVRYKHIDTGPRLLAVDLSRQLLPGTLEHALNYLLDHEIDLKHFDQRYRNDRVGAPAYPPAMLLKVVLYAYSQGILSSRGIERACRDHVIFVALSGESCPHFTTIADFVSSLGEDIAKVFAALLFLCQREGLIGRELKRIERFKTDAKKIRHWLKHHREDRKGPKGAIRKSNRTDNDSAKMATDKGVIQGFCGVAAVDAKHQIIVEAQVLGSGSEQEVLVPVVEAIKEQGLLTPQSVITADAGYHSEHNLKQLDALSVNALVADNAMRARDERFADQAKHKAKSDPLHDKARGQGSRIRRYQPADFTYDPRANTCTCPAGQRLYRNGSHCTIGAHTFIKFTAPAARLPGLRSTRALPAPPRHDQSPTSRLLDRTRQERARKLHRPDEEAHRLRARPPALRPALRHRGAGVRQHPSQQAHEPLYAPQQDQGRRAVEALLPRTQHREARASPLCEVALKSSEASGKTCSTTETKGFKQNKTAQSPETKISATEIRS